MTSTSLDAEVMWAVLLAGFPVVDSPGPALPCLFRLWTEVPRFPTPEVLRAPPETPVPNDPEVEGGKRHGEQQSSAGPGKDFGVAAAPAEFVRPNVSIV